MHTVHCVHWRQRKKNNAHNIHSTCSHTIDNAGQCTGLRPSRPSRRPGQCTQSTQSTMHHVHCTQCKKMHTIFTVHTITELGQWTGLWGAAWTMNREHKIYTEHINNILSTQCTEPGQYTRYTQCREPQSQDNVQGSRDGNSWPHPLSTTLSLHLMHPSRTFVQADRTIFQDVRCGAQLRLVSDWKTWVETFFVHLQENEVGNQCRNKLSYFDFHSPPNLWGPIHIGSSKMSFSEYLMYPWSPARWFIFGWDFKLIDQTFSGFSLMACYFCELIKVFADFHQWFIIGWDFC